MLGLFHQRWAIVVRFEIAHQLRRASRKDLLDEVEQEVWAHLGAKLHIYDPAKDFFDWATVVRARKVKDILEKKQKETTTGPEREPAYCLKVESKAVRRIDGTKPYCL